MIESIAAFYGTLLEIFLVFLAVIVVPLLGVFLVYAITKMFLEQAKCDRTIRSEAWVRLVKQTRKVRALRKEAAEHKPFGDNTWTT